MAKNTDTPSRPDWRGFDEHSLDERAQKLDRVLNDGFRHGFQAGWIIGATCGVGVVLLAQLVL